MKTLITIIIIIISSFQAYSQACIINHTCSKITPIPESVIIAAKQKLHIAYGHTSHGSQLTNGMTSLVTFMNGKGYTNNLYAWNNGGTGGALDLHDYAMAGDVGYYPDWVSNTRKYLGTPDPGTGRGTGTNADVNVIIWSWCGQVTSKYVAGTLLSEYINPMVQLETDYPGVKFVYMTGHLYHSDDARTKAANKTIRDFCINNSKILYDFADIESYDPDGIFYEFASDDCSYYESATGKLLGNWATNWQNSHIENVDWYNCSSAHSQPLNANQKAYSAWWLWASLAGWDQSTDINKNEQMPPIVSVSPNPVSDYLTISSNQGIGKIEIFSTLGLKVLETEWQEKIDVSGLLAGVYFVRIGNKVEKFVKI
ncbi:MAG: T9SS type A sorting domain-containing protein [bacterium]